MALPKDHPLADGGFLSRKLCLIVFTQALLVGSALAAVKWPAILAVFPTLAGALIASAGLYMTGNVAAKHVLGKQFDVSVVSKDPSDKAPTEAAGAEALPNG